MTSKRTLRQVAVALLLLVAFLFQGTWALAGTTGGMGGTVTDEAGAPVSGAAVKVASASQTAATTTDASGHFVFLSLTPDTYSVSIEKDGYSPVSYAGVTVFADQQETLSFRMQKALKTIAKTTATAPGALIKAGTTSDVYSVNAATASKVTGLGGGGGLDNAYSAIATVPGAYVPVGQGGWYQSVYIRGGDYDQVGYEVDGVPVNRSFDNYPSSTASALGQQEVQVYTGASPSNAEGQGLAGFINQVIKSGTYPGFGNSDLGIGGPAYYHKANIEAGGATPDRHFSYYAGFGGYNQDYRVFDQSNGSSLDGNYGAPMDWATDPSFTFNIGAFGGNNLYPLCGASGVSTDLCYESSNGLFPSNGPGGFVLGTYNYAATSSISDRESVVNFHFAIPHRKDGGRDDLQLLYQTSSLNTWFANSPSDNWGCTPQALNAGTCAGANANAAGSAAGTALGLGTPTYAAGYQSNAPLGSALSTVATACKAGSPAGSACVALAPGIVSRYGYPAAPSNLAVGGNIPSNLRDSSNNGIGIVKLQYQKNFGSDAYLRVYGYSFYSDWFLYGPNTTYADFIGVNPADYELTSHSRGLSASFSKQLNAKNLLTVQGSYTTASVIRDNNSQVFNRTQPLGVAVDAANPLSGICYNLSGAAGAATPQACSGTEGGAPTYLAIGGGIHHGIVSTTTGAQSLPDPSAYTCGGGPCEYLTVENGLRATYNAVKPTFTAYSITDEFDPTDRLHINLGLRFDDFKFDPQKTDTGATRTFWFNAWNNAMCFNPATPAVAPVAKSNVTLPCSDPANFGAGFVAATMSPVSSVQTFNVTQPRISFTYTVNPLNVLRFSYGKYDQAPNSAFEQYNTLQQDLPDFLGPTFYTYGRTSPTYPISPEISYNTDFSWEHQLKGTDISFKLTPFYRTTKDQIEQFFLSQKTGFVSGLNAGNQTSSGIEFQLQKGDFSKDGFAALFSYTYTDAKIKFSKFSNGSTIIDPINNGIAGYNAYTSACAAGGSAVNVQQNGQYLCGAAGPSALAAPCFAPATQDPVSGNVTAGVGESCATAGAIANPYYNGATQGLLDPTGSYTPYDLFPAGTGGGSYSSFVAPHVATLVLNYKKGKFAVTPALQFSAGRKYGYPLATQGIDPSSCVAALAGSATGDPRYPNGAVGGAPYDATSCFGTINIPNPDTAHFDGIGAFTDPTRLTMSAQFTYDVSPRVTSVLTLANIFDTCYGGTKSSWTNAVGVSQSKICGYGAGGIGGEINPVGNIYNPGATIIPLVAHSYGPGFGSLPFNAYLDFKIKL